MGEPDFYVYTGGKQYTLPDFAPDPKLNDPALYKPSDALKNAVNVAISLGRPLLLTGEPGSGKTQLAHNIAYSFGLQAPLVFNTRTSSKSTDLFYHYDAMRHLQHIQTKGETLDALAVEDQFITYRALGLAIRSGERQVVLIDEIDKAPRDLPNDILNVLEDLEFEVPEIQKSYRTQPTKRPILILTSNSEKNLPDAFLRRCIYFHLNFPTADELLAIVADKLEGGFYTVADLQTYAVAHFLELRDLLQRKKPGTAELLNWISVLERLQFPIKHLKDYSFLDIQGKRSLLMSYHVLAKTEEDLRVLRNLLNV